jgi:hypothetical protein
MNIGKEGTVANYMVRLKTETANLKRIIYRVSIIKNTDFIPSVFTSIQVIALIFLGAYSLLNTDPWWGGLIIICLFTTVIFSILILIRDLEDPFEYDHSGDLKTDEVNLDILDVLQKEFEEKKDG